MQAQAWTRHFYYRKESIKTTWTFRLALSGCLVLFGFLTQRFWIPGIARTLVCAEQVRPADAILVDNLDEDYLLFERAAALRDSGLGPRVLIPTVGAYDPRGPSVAEGVVEVMARVARLRDWHIVAVQAIEPISLNAAYEVRRFLAKEKIRSVAIVTSGFRSRRSALVYQAVLGPAGVTVSCVPVFGQKTPATWTETWHGVQEVVLQLVKLQYYRFYVLPLEAWKRAA